MDERGTFLAAAHAFAALVGRLPEDGYDGPGLGAWDLRALVGHASRSLVTVLTYLDEPGRPEDVEASSPEAYYAAVAATLADPAQAGAVLERGRAAGEALGDDPAQRVAQLVEEVAARLRDAGDDDVLTTIVGPMRVRDYLPTRTFELVVHGLDIALATRLPHRYDEALLAAAAALAARTGVRLGRGEDVLLALTGRAALPTGFSVV